MTPSELKALSIAAAEVVREDSYVYVCLSDYDSDSKTYLHEDSARCFELAVKFDIDIRLGPHSVKADWYFSEDLQNFADHNNDKLLAARVAILRALVAMKEKV